MPSACSGYLLHVCHDEDECSLLNNEWCFISYLNIIIVSNSVVESLLTKALNVLETGLNHHKSTCTSS